MQWGYPNGSSTLYLMIGLTLLVGFGIIFGMMSMPSQWRRYVVVACTFLAGAIYVAFYLFPKPLPDAQPGLATSIGNWLKNSQGPAGDIGQALTTFLLGLGIYSLVHIHGKKLIGMKKDWGFSLVLLSGMFLMVFFGYINYFEVKFGPHAVELQSPTGWGFTNYVSDFLFDGLLQQMDAAMFSIIAFYILSAAYRAFRIRSVEATILLASALVMMLSLMGAVEHFSSNFIAGAGLSDNFTLANISEWIKGTFQNSGLRALDFGIGLGALAMGLRLWLSLEKGGISA